ncbi:MAG: AbrB/MazE/SpoVT family DNA-binding domain-containing protein [Armatimonadota bacterium]
MNNAQVLVVGKHGEIQVPEEVRHRYHLEPETPVRLVETRAGILIVPLTSPTISSEFERELEWWQQVAADSWKMFPYEE